MSQAAFSTLKALCFVLSDHKKRRLSQIRASCTHWGEAGRSGEEEEGGGARWGWVGGLVHSFNSDTA